MPRKGPFECLRLAEALVDTVDQILCIMGHV